MKRSIPKIKDFKAPAGYFDQLPDQILEKTKPTRSIQWMNYAAAVAIFLVSFAVWQLNDSNPRLEEVSMDEEVSLYIESQYWSAEDVLGMVDNPEQILDEIIAEEMVFEVDAELEEEMIWY
ncbi:hypothetical protein PBT90_07560 [Algoriphagus halophytocola]|uniref:DUF3379 domain-containing protein n=1 Tax=Algoriphagus halophytocola TaxID=2991499 RepID=A0ABY6MHH4_9BACT|nr:MULTISPECIES: hypothetical protein [unclassified Algoriphagus]UZD23243.1 hypothetical protein OM944_01875 [Algoriphagus sp. TR-M5]WBL44537.1 hypothetical protein PBT90_07560 [Algoriphagus sp. TR-M9]